MINETEFDIAVQLQNLLKWNILLHIFTLWKVFYQIILTKWKHIY